MTTEGNPGEWYEDECIAEGPIHRALHAPQRGRQFHLHKKKQNTLTVFRKYYTATSCESRKESNPTSILKGARKLLSPGVVSLQ